MKTKKYARRVIKSTSLGRILDKLRKHYKAEHQPEYIVIPYVLTCAAYLESKLNDSLLDAATKKYGEDTADAFMSLSLPKKLSVIVPVMTDGHYRINKEHFVYQRLISLIRVRNSLAHAKSDFEEITAADEDLIEIPLLNARMIKMPKQHMNEPDITLGASKSFTPLEYHEALEKLEKWFFQRCPDRLNKVAMVVDRSKDNKWEEVCTAWVKHLD